MPSQFDNWNSIYHKFRKWCADDVFEKILQALVATTEKYLLVEIDSTFYVAKQAATAVATRAAATVGLGAVAGAAVPWVVGGLTVWQLGKLGCKLLDRDKKINPRTAGGDCFV